MKRGIAFLIAAAVCVVAGGVTFAAAAKVSVLTGLYWGVETGTTVGYGDVTPHNGTARTVAVVVMLLSIPLFAASFGSFTSAHISGHVRRHVNAAVSAIGVEADLRHAALVKLAEEQDRKLHERFDQHAELIKTALAADAQVSAGAGSNPAESGLPADERVAPPAAATRTRRKAAPKENT